MICSIDLNGHEVYAEYAIVEREQHFTGGYMRFADIEIEHIWVEIPYRVDILPAIERKDNRRALIDEYKQKCREDFQMEMEAIKGEP